MFDFDRGDPENLAGRALLYVRNRRASEEGLRQPTTPSLLIASNPYDLLIMLKSYDEISPADEKAIIDGRGKAVHEAIEKNPDKPTICHPFYLDLTLDVDKIRSQGVNGDVVQVAEVYGCERANHLLGNASRVYMGLFFSQIEEEFGSMDRYDHLPTFRDLATEQFKEELKRLARQLIYNTEHRLDDPEIFAALGKLSRGSPFLIDVSRLCKISRSKLNRKLDLMSLYLKKIYASLDEDYVAAAGARDEIVSREII